MLFLPLLLLFAESFSMTETHRSKSWAAPNLCGAVMPVNGHVSIYGVFSRRRWSFAWAGKGRWEMGRLERERRCWATV